MPLMTITKPRKKRCIHQPEEAPFPIPIETITNKPASNRHWFFYQAQMIDNNVVVQNEGDIVFLSKMGFFGKGILSRSKPEHQFFASSFQGSQRKNLPPKERRFQQQRFQQVRQHKYERHLSWQKQLSLQRRNQEEMKESKTPLMSEESMENPSYRVPTVPAKRVKRATISERNHRAGITAATPPRRESTESRLVPESEEELLESSQPDEDSKRMLLSEDILIDAARHVLQACHVNQINQAHLTRELQRTRVTPSSNGHVTVKGGETGRLASPPSHSGEEGESRQEGQVSCRLQGTDDSEASKFVFQSQATGVQHTIGSCELAPSCLPNPDQDQSGQPDVSEKISSTGQSELIWETRHADWADCMEEERAGEVDEGDTNTRSNNKDLVESSRNRTSACARSWRTAPKEWEKDQDPEKILTAQSQAGCRQPGIDDGENGGPSQMTGAVTTGSYTSTSALGMEQTSIEGEKKRGSGHPSLSEGWTSDHRDWAIGEEDQVLVSEPQDHKDSEEEDQGFDDSCEVSEQQNVGMVVQTNRLQRQEDLCVSDQRTDQHRGIHDDQTEPSTSKTSHIASCGIESEEPLFLDRMETDYSSTNPENLSVKEQKENVRKSDDRIPDCIEGDKIQESKESSKAPDSDCNHSNADDAFVAVPTPVEFEDATTSQTESNNILSLKGRDARKKIREVKSGPVRNKDPYPISEYLQLSYEEAFFLSYGLGCLNLRSSNQVQMDLTEMWRTFRGHQPSFVANYIVYHFFRSKGWLPKTGLKFGADFILYKKGPPFYHASYCVYVFMINEEDIDHQGVHKMNWASLMGRDRVIENAAKELMFCFVIKPSKLQTKDLDSPACIPHFKVQEMVMKRWVPSRGRQQDNQPEEVT